jgi:hypothetical protein
MRGIALRCVVLLAAVFGASSCGGLPVPYEALDRSFKGNPNPGARPEAYAITCKDKKKKLPTGVPAHVTVCSNGGAFPWKVLGAYRVPPGVSEEWNLYQVSVQYAAGANGCPAIAIRDKPPTVEHTGEAVGAFCIDPKQPSGYRGALRIRTSLQPGETAKIMNGGGGRRGARGGGQPRQGEGAPAHGGGADQGPEAGDEGDYEDD